MRTTHLLAVAVVICLCTPMLADDAVIEPLVAVIDLDVGQTQRVTLHDGSTATVTLVSLSEQRDSIRHAVRRAQVEVKVNGHPVTLVSSTYHLPTTVGDVQIYCPVTRGYLENSSKANAWGLARDARIRLWPGG